MGFTGVAICVTIIKQQGNEVLFLFLNLSYSTFLIEKKNFIKKYNTTQVKKRQNICIMKGKGVSDAITFID